MTAVAELGDKIAGLTIAQAVELKNYLKEKYEIEPAAGGAVMMAAAPAAAAARGREAAEATEFNVVLEPGFDAAKKINVIKVVREITGLGLKEAKATGRRRAEGRQGKRRTRRPPRTSRRSSKTPARRSASSRQADCGNFKANS